MPRSTRNSPIDPKTKIFLANLGRRSLREKTAESKRRVVMTMVDFLEIPEKKIHKMINYYTFVDCGLQRWLWTFFHNSPFEAISFTYPEKKLWPYHMAKTPNGYWKGVRGKVRAVFALRKILQKTKASPADYPKLLTNDFFEKTGLERPLLRLFNYDRFAYLNAAFPDQYRPWEFKVTTPGFFDSDERIIEAVKWLIEEVLGYPMVSLSVHQVWEMQIGQNISQHMFCQNGLREILTHYSVSEACNMAYPGKFLPWSFIRHDMWSGQDGLELAARATKWLIEEHVGINPRSPKISCSFFRKHHLWGMLTSKKLGFNSSPAKALKNAFGDPDQYVPSPAPAE